MKAKAYTDGSCSGNPGPMGWAALVMMTKEDNDWALKDYIRLKAKFDPDPNGTNNRAEIMGVIEALKMIKKENRKHCDIVIYLDSLWVRCSLDGTYRKVKKNLDLLSKAAGLMAQYKSCSLRYVQGHAGEAYNEIADNYAVSARTTQAEFDLMPPAIMALRSTTNMVAE